MIGARSYEKRKQRSRARQADMSAAGRDIGAIPPCANPRRRARCKGDLKAFLKTYFPKVFCDPWSSNHIRVIEKEASAIRHGGLFALAMPRGSGKTAISTRAALWAILYGYRRYVVLFGATEKMAGEIIDTIKKTIETNELIRADFPEVCFPVEKLEGIVNRCKGQTHKGKRTYIEWGADHLVMPTIDGSACSGSVIDADSITCANIRGKHYTTSSGESIRPDFCIIDDPQTPESAASEEQCKKRWQIISSDILRMAGPGIKMTAVMPCTVIEKGDLADRVLNTELHPEWNGERMRLMDAMPDNMDLWDKYREVWARSQREHAGSIKDATEFYRQNRAAMDAGALPTWPARYEPGEISAVQSAMNILIANRKVFYCEFQNEPQSESDEADQLTTELLSDKLNGLPRNRVPLGCDNVTMYIDIHDKLLFYVVAAFDNEFTGAVIDYGTWPRQKTSDFTMDDARYTMVTQYDGMGRSARIYAALTDLTALCLSTDYKREDGAALRITRCHIDANWGPETPVVYRFCRQNQMANILTPCHGRGILASGRPLSARKPVKGEKPGTEWYLSGHGAKRGIRFCAYDTNYWKTFVAQRIKTATGDIGSLTFWGNDVTEHATFFSHMCAEYFTPTAGRGRVVDVWQPRPQHPDNHWWDCLTGAVVAASVAGVALTEVGTTSVKKEKKMVALPAYIPQ